MVDFRFAAYILGILLVFLIVSGFLSITIIQSIYSHAQSAGVEITARSPNLLDHFDSAMALVLFSALLCSLVAGTVVGIVISPSMRRLGGKK